MGNKKQTEADYIILCDAIFTSKEKNTTLDGGVAVKKDRIVKVGNRMEVSEFLGIKTRVLQFQKAMLLTYRTGSEEEKDIPYANIMVLDQNKKNKYKEIRQLKDTIFLMYKGEVVLDRRGVVI